MPAQAPNLRLETSVLCLYLYDTWLVLWGCPRKHVNEISLLALIIISKGSFLCCKGSVPVPQTPSLKIIPRQEQEHNSEGHQGLWIAVLLGCGHLPVSLLLETLKLVRLGSSEGSSAGRGPEATGLSQIIYFLSNSLLGQTVAKTSYCKVRPAGDLF